MKKISLLIILLLCLFVGILIGRPTASSIEEKLKLFEENITSPSSTYTEPSQIEPSLPSKIGKKGEEVIDKIFSFSFDIISSLAGDK